jgi:Autotransporter beta-domain
VRRVPRVATRVLLGLAWLLSAAPASAQASVGAVQGVNVQQLANAVLGMMSYMVAPDVTTGSLSIDNGSTANADLFLTQLGGGFTWSRELPLYLEGNAAYARFDPVFVVSDGVEARSAPTRWNAVALTGGIGWDFGLSEHWVLRPIFNFTLGTVASDLQVARWWVENQVEGAVEFLDGGRLQAYGLGGSLMLDYEKFATEADDDIEIRYTHVDLRSRSSTPQGVEGSAKTESLGIWTRRRVPTGWGHVWDRPVRYVYEFAFTRFLGSQAELGISHMSSLGFGLELDSSALDRWATRWRVVARYRFGPGLEGWSAGLAISF